jgi:hypothetical protein
VPSSYPTSAPSVFLPPSAVPTAALVVLLDADFSITENGFVYEDDLFRNSAAPDYSAGVYSNQFQYLEVQVGGVDDLRILDMSGGFVRPFELDEPAVVTVEVNFGFLFAASFDAGESAQALCSIDGVLLTTDIGNDFMVQFTGNGSGSPQQQPFGTVTVQSMLLQGGSHSIAVGAYVSSKNRVEESSTMAIRSVTVKARYQ